MTLQEFIKYLEDIVALIENDFVKRALVVSREKDTDNHIPEEKQFQYFEHRLSDICLDVNSVKETLGNSTKASDIRLANEKLNKLKTDLSKVGNALKNGDIYFSKSGLDENDVAAFKNQFITAMDSLKPNYDSVIKEIENEKFRDIVNKYQVQQEQMSAPREYDTRFDFLNPADIERRETYIDKTAGAFTSHINQLKDAKTFYNSSEYNEIIKAVEFANVYDKITTDASFADDKACVVKLLAIKEKIDKYLSHKAEDGVKQNSFKKLAAVEALNKEVTDRLNDLNVGFFRFQEKEFDKNAKTLTYGQEVRDCKQKNPNVVVPNPMSDDMAKNCISIAQRLYPSVDGNDIVNADNCMCRILLKAYKDDVSAKQINKLENMRKQLRINPVQEVKEPKKLEAATKPAQPQIGL